MLLPHASVREFDHHVISTVPDLTIRKHCLMRLRCLDLLISGSSSFHDCNQLIPGLRGTMQANTRASVAVSRALQDSFAKALQDTKTAGTACVNLEAYIVGHEVNIGVLSDAGLLTLLAKLSKSPVSSTCCGSDRLLQQESCT